MLFLPSRSCKEIEELCNDADLGWIMDDGEVIVYVTDLGEEVLRHRQGPMVLKRQMSRFYEVACHTRQ